MRANSLIGAAVAGAVVAAAMVGLGEAALIALGRGLGLDLGLVRFALLFYGGVGVLAGLGAGIGLRLVAALGGARIEAATAFAMAGAATLSALATIIGRFRVFRDVFHETLEGQMVGPLGFQLASGGVAVGLLVTAFLVLRAGARRQSWLASPLLVMGTLVVAIAGAWAAWTPDRAEPSGRPRAAAGPAPVGPSVLLMMVDTLRADHLSCYGYTAHATPSIDGLAADGVRFAQAQAQASWTRPSVATILSSLYPSSHQAVHKSDVLPDAVVTLPEVLQAAGYRTVGFANNINVAPLFNFQQGFDEYHFLEPTFFFGATEAAAQLTIYNQLRLLRERYVSGAKRVEHYYQPAEVVSERALAWLDGHGDRPFFMFLHFMEPHDPYFEHPYNGEGLARVANPNPDGALADRYRAAYDGEIRYLDAQIGALLEKLKTRALYDRTLIVLTSDHGEEFHEHGGWWHGLTLYEEQVGVPLIVKAPRGREVSGVVNEGLVSSIDIAPTILALTGVPVPESMQGSPLGMSASAPAPRDHAFAEQDLEGNILQAYRRNGWKLIEANPGNPRGLPPVQLFEVARDPKETQDLASSAGDRVGALAADLTAVRTHAQTLAVESSETAIDGATQERLRALGYVH